MPSKIKIKRTANPGAVPNLAFGELAVTSTPWGETTLVIGDMFDNTVEIGGTNFAQLNSNPLAQNIKQVLLKYINLH